MKCILAVLLLFGNCQNFQVYGEKMREELEILMQQPGVSECISETGFNPTELVEHPSSEPKEEMFCFMKCMAEAIGVLQPDGVLNPDKLSDVDDRLVQFSEKTVEAVKKCASSMKVETCQDVPKFVACVERPPA